MYTDVGYCTFPGCDRLIPLMQIADDEPRLCFDHGEMLFYGR
jgi:hypothetical protein